MSMEKIVISFGGSVVVPDKPDTKYMMEIKNMLLELMKEYQIFVVVGGGRTARTYINSIKSFYHNDTFLDNVGITATRINALFFISAFLKEELTPPFIPENFERAAELSTKYPLIVMGGTHPGHTTDAVAAMLGEFVGAKKFINITNVPGVYDSDPKTNPKAKMITSMNYKKLRSIVFKEKNGAGMNVVIDPVAVDILERSGMTSYVVGKDIANIKKAVRGETFIGTLIQGD